MDSSDRRERAKPSRANVPGEGVTAGDVPPPLPADMVDPPATATAGNTSTAAAGGRPVNDRALALPTVQDLRNPWRLAQVVVGLLGFIVYANFAVAVGNTFGDQFDVVPGVAAVVLPPLLVAGAARLLRLRALGRGFVLGIVLSVVGGTAYGLYRASRGGR